MDKAKIDKMLGDIIELAPELKGKEKEMRQIIADILAAKPAIEIDPAFEARLRKEVIAKIKGTAAAPASRAFRFPIHKLSYVAGLAVLIFAFVISREFVPTGNHEQDYNGPAALTSDEIKESIKVVSASETLHRVAKGAFGQIVLSASDNTALNQAGSADETKSSAEPAVSIGIGSGNNAMSTSAKIAPSYEYPVFKYVYKGEPIAQDQKTVDVYKRLKSAFGGQEIADYITRLDYGLINMAKFKGAASITNITLNEEREFGYSVNINAAENTISLFPNWLRWTRPDSACRDEACFASYRTRYEDIPDSASLIKVSGTFLDEYGIAKDDYGAPVVQDNFRIEYEKAADKSQVYLPEEISVVYPYKIAGLESVDESGNPAGLFVSVNIRQNRVSSLNTLAPKNFEVSAYDAITDSGEIIALAEQGGAYPSYADPQAKKVVEVSLGTPARVLARQYRYDQSTGTSEEFFIPALSFPVTGISDDSVYFYRKNVIVPLAEGMQDNEVPMLYKATPVSEPMTK